MLKYRFDRSSGVATRFAAIAAAVVALPATAHHPIHGKFDTSEEMTLDGVVTYERKGRDRKQVSVYAA